MARRSDWPLPGDCSLVGYSPWGHKESDSMHNGRTLSSPIVQKSRFRDFKK